MTKAKTDKLWKLDKNQEPLELDGRGPAGQIPDVVYVWPWEAALWRAFGTVEQFAGVLPRSFDQGTLMPMPPASSNSPDALRVRAEQLRRVDWHRRFDEAEREVIRLLAAGKFNAVGQKPARDRNGNRLRLADPTPESIPQTTFLNPEIAFGPNGEIEARGDTLSNLFPPLEVRGTNADPSIPWYYNVLIPVVELRAVWKTAGGAVTVAAVAVGKKKTLQKWLEEQMRISPEQSPGKAKMRETARNAGQSFSDAMFSRAFAAAVEATGAVKWSASGRKPKHPN